MSVPRTWKYNTNSELQEIFSVVLEEARSKHIVSADCCPTLYTFKSTRTWGYAYKDSKTYAVALNEVYLKDPWKSFHTVVHEVCHLNTHSRHHDATWYRDFENLGKSFGLSGFTRTARSEDEGLDLPEKEVRYEVYCPHCGYTWKYSKRTRAVQHPELYRCRKCKVNLKSREVNK